MKYQSRRSQANANRRVLGAKRTADLGTGVEQKSSYRGKYYTYSEEKREDGLRSQNWSREQLSARQRGAPCEGDALPCFESLLPECRICILGESISIPVEQFLSHCREP